MRKKILINDNWFFAKIPNGEMTSLPTNITEFTKVNIPHTWYQDNDQYNGITLYEKELELTKNSNKEYYLEFNAADRYAKVYFNGEFIGEHKGGYSTFRLPLKSDLIQKTNKLSVLLDNRSYDEISPLTGDFTVYGGIYRDVYLIEVNKIHFDLMFYGSLGLIIRTSVKDARGVINLEPHIVNATKDVQIKYELFNLEGKIIKEETTEVTSEVIEVDSPILWNGKENPYQYTLKATLYVAGLAQDEVSLKIGFKEIKLDANKGFFLNGQHLKLNGVAKHQDDGIKFNALNQADLVRDINCIKEIGANAIRLSHYQHPQEMYDLCDAEGFVTWAEIPMLKMLNTPESYKNAEEQLKELIYQNIHHVSICFWGFQNEIAIFGEAEYMYEQCEKLNSLVKALDPNRFSTVANLYSVKNESRLNKMSDAVGYNIYFGWYYGKMEDNADFIKKFHEDCPNVPLGISEYGVDSNIAYHQEQPKVKDYSEEYQALYHETVYPIFREADYVWGTFIWNMFDFGSARRNEGGIKYRNGKGLVKDDHQTKKDAFYYYKAQWSAEPFVHITKKRFLKHAESKIEIKVYSNQKKVNITINGNTYTKEAINGVFSFKDVELIKGENKVLASSGNLKEEAIFILQDTPEASYTYVDENPEITVRNWFLDEQEKASKFSVLSPAIEIVNNEEAMKVLDKWNKQVADAIRVRNGGMPLQRILNYMRKDINLTNESLEELNKELLKIKKKW